jgi:uncharacterized protein (UPF0276 family)
MGDGGPAASCACRHPQRIPAVRPWGWPVDRLRRAALIRTISNGLPGVVERYQPAMVSEHLAWSSHDAGYFNDLLPVPYDRQTLDRVVTAHIGQIQDRLKRPILLENPSTYVAFEQSTMSETDFIREIAQKSGCGLLLDINNVFVSATNHGWKPMHYLRDFPLELVEEIHLAGHAEDVDDEGDLILIDAHDRPVADAVWKLYETSSVRPEPCRP